MGGLDEAGRGEVDELILCYLEYLTARHAKNAEHFW